MAARDFQQLIGIVLAIYGFFVAISPDRFTVPYIDRLLPRITSQQQSIAGLVLLIIGIFLFTRKRLITEL